jgi:hypothetical protein
MIALFYRNFGRNLTRGFALFHKKVQPLRNFPLCLSLSRQFYDFPMSYPNITIEKFSTYILIPKGLQLTTNSNRTFFLFLCFENPLFQKSPWSSCDSFHLKAEREQGIYPVLPVL